VVSFCPVTPRLPRAYLFSKDGRVFYREWEFTTGDHILLAIIGFFAVINNLFTLRAASIAKRAEAQAKAAAVQSAVNTELGQAAAKAIQEVHISINSRMDQLLSAKDDVIKAATDAATAQGKAEGIAAQKAENALTPQIALVPTVITAGAMEEKSDDH